MAYATASAIFGHGEAILPLAGFSGPPSPYWRLPDG